MRSRTGFPVRIKPVFKKPGFRGAYYISAEKEAAVLDCWKSNPGFGAGRSGGSFVGGYL